MALIDAYGRRIDYLRMSITDQCNLNCRYCMPLDSSRPHMARSQILTYEELAKVADAAVAAGISKIRITGGEPLVRKEMPLFCAMLSRLPGLRTLALTTNGMELAAMAGDLYRAGVRGLNISLDTLQAQRFRYISGKDGLARVLAGLQAAEAAGFAPIKINTVVMRGINDDEIAELAAMTLAKPWHVRFIELMPFQNANPEEYGRYFMPVDEIARRIPGIEAAQPESTAQGGGPARLYTLPGAMGRVGFIAPVSRHFCEQCNRLRLTADGQLRTCLFARNETDIKSALRSGASKQMLVALLERAVLTKPWRHGLQAHGCQYQPTRSMNAIGG